MKNGDRWTVTATNEDGSMVVKRAGGGGSVVLPARLRRRARRTRLTPPPRIRAQGRTVDTAHAIVSPTTTREVLYVSATRGRDSNRLYVDIALRPRPGNLPRRA